MTLQFPVEGHVLHPPSHPVLAPTLHSTQSSPLPKETGNQGWGLGARHSHSQEVRWYQGINPDMSLKPRLFLLHQVGPPHLYNNRGSLGNTDLG